MPSMVAELIDVHAPVTAEDSMTSSLTLYMTILSIVSQSKDDAATMQLVLARLQRNLTQTLTAHDCLLAMQASRHLRRRLPSDSLWNLHIPFSLPPLPPSLCDSQHETRETLVETFLRDLTDPSSEWLYSAQSRCALCCLAALLDVSPTAFLLTESKRSEALGRELLKASTALSESNLDASDKQQNQGDTAEGIRLQGREGMDADDNNDWSGFALGTAAAVAGGSLMLLTAGLAAPVLAAFGGAFLGVIPLAGPVLAPVVTSSVSVAAITGGLTIFGAHTAAATTIDLLGSVEQYGFLDLDAFEEEEVWETLPDLEAILADSCEGTTSGQSGHVNSATSPSEKKEDEEKDEIFSLPILPLRLLPSPQRSASTAIKLAICVSGFVSASSSSELCQPWRLAMATHTGSCERFVLLFDVSILRAVAWTESRFMKEEALSGTLTMATFVVPTLWPIGLLRLLGGLSSPWTSALRRSKEAGIMLGRQLAKLHEARGARPTTLLGFSLGARVVFFALLELSRLGVRGVVESAVLLGAPVEADDSLEEWKAARSVVVGRLVNVFSPRDVTLSIIHRYKTLDAVSVVAGLSAVLQPGIENSDASDLITNHENYEEKTPMILKRLGFC